MGTKSNITFFEAIKDTFSFFLGGKNSHNDQSEQNDMIDEPENTVVVCPRCQGQLIMVNQLISDFLTMIIYRCPECGVMKEVQFDQKDGNLMKDITIYNPFSHSASAYMEIVHECKFNEFAIDRLWEVAGELCYPVLMKTQFSENVDLVFIKVQDDLSRNEVHGYIINDVNMIGKVQVQKNDDFSYFLNPYLYKIPHSTYLYATTASSINENVAPVTSVRYRFKSSNMRNSYLYELCIIEDFPLQSYGIDLQVKFGSFNNLDDTPLTKVIKLIDLESIVKGTESRIDDNDGIFIKHHRISKINLYSSTNFISKDLREHFYDSIVKFFTLIG